MKYKPEDYINSGFYDGLPTYIANFAKLWNSIYAAPKAVKNREGEIMYYESYPWEDIQETREYKGKPWYVCGNPWVYVYEFERVSEA